ncbi:MAG: hypothetical protein FJY21_11130 [Bacteroidetes bacterium]|nr:hypothetical protein [Bacteroidota bacterium]
MNFKTIAIIIISVLVTIILMNNTEEIDFWIFGDTRMPKLAVFGAIFGLGLLFGFLAGRPSRRIPPESLKNSVVNPDYDEDYNNTQEDQLSDEDRDYIR